MKYPFYIKKAIIRVFALFLLFHFYVLAAQQDKTGELRQYLFPAFNVGSVKTINGMSKDIILNYNTVTEKMVFEQNGKYYDLIHQKSVDTIYLLDKKFIPYENFFLEILYQDKISLGIQHKSNLQAPGKPVGYGGTSELASSNYLTGIELSSGYFNLKIPDDYIVKYSPVYWIKTGDTWQKFFTAKQFLKLFPEYSKALSEFIRKSRIKFDKSEDITKLVKYCNEIMK